MQMIAPPPPRPNSLIPPWALVPVPVLEGGQGVELWAAHGWEVTAGSPEQKPLGSARGLFPSSQPQTHSNGRPAPPGVQAQTHIL